MNEEILINVTPQETRVAVMQSGVAQELHIELASIRGLVGNIYMGKVARVLPGMQSAFVEIGLERAAFLHVADIWEERQNSHGNGEPGKAAQKPIEKILAEGQPLLVQVVKDPIGTKGARLSTQVSIAGRMLVYLPQDPHIGISQRIEDESGRQMLRDKVQQMLPADEKGGFIIRTMAETATDAELLNDLQYLRKLWQDLRAKSLSSPAPALLHQDLSLAQHALRQRQVLVQQRGRGRGQAFRAQVLPQLPQVLEIVQQLGVGGSLGHGADDEAAFFIGGQHLLHLVAQHLAPAFILDALRDADVRILRQVHQHPAGDADLGREACALGADRVLDHLHQQRLALGEDFFDRLLRRFSRLAVAMAVVALLPDVGGVEGSSALHVDIAHQPAARRALDVQFLRDAALHHGYPRFLRRDVDQDLLVHAGILLSR